MGEVIITAILLGVVALCSLGYDSYACDTKTRAMGRPSTWGPVQGCMIQMKSGEWVPLDRYRAID